MVNSQAGMLEPGSKELILASARSSVSCTRSSARSTFPDSEIANARRLGTAARTASRTDGSIFITAALHRPFYQDVAGARRIGRGHPGPRHRRTARAVALRFCSESRVRASLRCAPTQTLFYSLTTTHVGLAYAS